MDIHGLTTFLPLLGLTAGWRGVRIGGKTLGMGGGLGSSNSPLVQAFDKAKAEGDRTAMERIARQMNEARLKQKGRVESKTASGTKTGFDPNKDAMRVAESQGISEPLRFLGEIAPSEGRSLNSRTISSRARQRRSERQEYKDQLAKVESQYRKDALSAFEKREYSLLDAFNARDKSTGRYANALSAWDVLADRMEAKGISIPSPFRLNKMRSEGKLEQALRDIERQYFAE